MSQQSSQSVYDALIESIGEGVAFMNPDGEIQRLNPQAEKLLQLKFSEVQNKKLVDVSNLQTLDGNKIPADKRPFNQALKTKSTITTKARYVFPNGDYLPVKITVAPVLHQNEIIGTIAIISDITPEIEAEKLKDEYLSLVSHQLRTPLVAMRWHLQLLTEQLHAPSNQITTILDQTARIHQNMLLLVTSLLNITRIESGRLLIEPTPTNICDLLDGIIKEMTAAFEHKQQSVKYLCEKNLKSINLDSNLIHIIFQNLLSNANKYSPENTIITITAITSHSEVIIEVRDQGIGIPLDEQNQIFNKFYRTTTATQSHQEGTGLGLYMTKKIVEMTGGKMWFTSRPNNGTSFFFTIPLSGHIAKGGEVRLTK